MFEQMNSLSTNHRPSFNFIRQMACPIPHLSHAGISKDQHTNAAASVFEHAIRTCDSQRFLTDCGLWVSVWHESGRVAITQQITCL